MDDAATAASINTSHIIYVHLVYILVPFGGTATAVVIVRVTIWMAYVSFKL